MMKLVTSSKWISSSSAAVAIVTVFSLSASAQDPAWLSDCMQKLMYRTEVQKPLPGYTCMPNDFLCKTIRVRTEISDVAAAQACKTSTNPGISQPVQNDHQPNGSNGFNFGSFGNMLPQQNNAGQPSQNNNYGTSNDYGPTGVPWIERMNREYEEEEKARREENSGAREAEGI